MQLVLIRHASPRAKPSESTHESGALSSDFAIPCMNTGASAAAKFGGIRGTLEGAENSERCGNAKASAIGKERGNGGVIEIKKGAVDGLEALKK